MVRTRRVVTAIGVELVQRRARAVLPLEDVSVDPVRYNRESLVFHVLARRHREDIIQLLKRALLDRTVSKGVRGVEVRRAELEHTFVSGSQSKIITKARAFIAA
jgi:hypothetical protein